MADLGRTRYAGRTVSGQLRKAAAVVIAAHAGRGVSMARVAELMGCSHSSAAMAIGSLVRDGFLVIERRGRDHRGVAASHSANVYRVSVERLEETRLTQEQREG